MPDIASQTQAGAQPLAVIDKLTIINRALIATSNTPVNVADDGSDEWTVGSNAYDRMLPVIMATRNWKFQTTLNPLVRLGTSAYPGFSDVYGRPADCLQFMNCWDTLAASKVLPVSNFGVSQVAIRGPQFDYRIIGNHIHCNGPNGVTAHYVKYPASGDPMGILFAEALTKSVEAILEKGLNDDGDASRGTSREAMGILDLAASRDTQEDPRKIPFRSRLQEARRSRGRR